MIPGAGPMTGFAVDQSIRARNDLTALYETIFGVGTVLSLAFGDEAVTDTGASIAMLPSRKGITAALPASTGRATKATVLGRGAAVFAKAVPGCGYAVSPNAKTVVAVARHNTAAFSNYERLLGYDASTPSIAGNSGASTMLAGNGTISRDGVTSYANNDTFPHVWSNHSATTTSTVLYVGGINTTGAGLTWDGEIWHFAQLSVEATAAQLATLNTALEGYYSFLAASKMATKICNAVGLANVAWFECGCDLSADFGAAFASTWPNRVGAPTYTTVGTWTVASFGGRKALAYDSAVPTTDRITRAFSPSVAVKSGVTVLRQDALHTNSQYWVGGSGAVQIAANSNTYALVVTAPVYHRIDGVAKETLTQGKPSIVSWGRSDGTSITELTITTGWPYSGGRNPRGALALNAGFTIEPTDAQWAAVNEAIAEYYVVALTPKELLKHRVARICGGYANVLSLGVMADAVTDGSNNITQMPSLLGVSPTPAGTGRAVKQTVSGYSAAVFSGTAINNTYHTVGGSMSAGCVARYDGALPFVASTSLVNGGYPPYLAASGGANTFVLNGQSLYKDGFPGNVVDFAPHLYAASYSSANAATSTIGGRVGEAGRNWIGIIWAWYQSSVNLTAAQHAEINAAFREYFSSAGMSLLP